MASPLAPIGPMESWRLRSEPRVPSRRAAWSAHSTRHRYVRARGRDSHLRKVGWRTKANARGVSSLGPWRTVADLPATRNLPSRLLHQARDFREGRDCIGELVRATGANPKTEDFRSSGSGRMCSPGDQADRSASRGSKDRWTGRAIRKLLPASNLLQRF